MFFIFWCSFYLRCVGYLDLTLHFALQAKLQEFLGRKELDKHLDADEAIVLGASLHAANLSDGIKLNRKLGMIDGSSYGFVFELNGDDLLKDENTRQLIVPRMKKLPSKVNNFWIQKVVNLISWYQFDMFLLHCRCSDLLFTIKILKFHLLMRVKV